MTKIRRFIITHDEVCPECDGYKEILKGLDGSQTCPECEGAGMVAGTTEVFDDEYN